MSSASFIVAPDLAAASSPADGPLTHNPRHSDEAVSHLIDLFRKPRWSALLRAIVDELQICEDTLFQILAAFDVDTAVGEQLDFIGKSVGERRMNRGDDDYRAAVRARQLVNRSDGKPEQLYAIVLALFPTAVAEVREFFPASVVVYFAAPLGGVTLDTVATLLRQAKLGGVRLDVEHYDPATDLIAADSDFADVALGAGRDDDPSVGGRASARL